MKHIISVLVENKFGVLSRIAGLFSGRGFNIETISSGQTLDPGISQITIVTTGEDHIYEQIIKQLNKQIDIIKVTDLADKEFVEREMCLVKVNAPMEHRAEALRIADIFRARVVDSSQKSYTFMVTGDEKKIAAFLELVQPMGIKEIVRSGKLAITRE
jgi:acetolactate synthase I/III small subunit